MKIPILSVLSIVCLAAPCWAESRGVSDYDPSSKELAPAPILIRKARGDVKATTTANPSPFSLKDGAKITQGSTITTGRRSKVSLVFSNGATVTLGPETTLRINEYLQAGGQDFDLAPVGPGGPPKTSIRGLAESEKEVSISRTKLHVQRGTTYNRVKKLHKQSYFLMSTPLGTARVLGTAWEQSNKINPDELKMITEVAVREGTVEFDAIDANGSEIKPTIIRAGLSSVTTGTFGSLQDLQQFEGLSAIEGVDINVSVDVSTLIQPSAQDFPQVFDNQAPAVDQVALVAAPTTPDTSPFFSGVLAPGFTGGFGGGAGGGGSSQPDQPEEPDQPPTPLPTPTPPPPPS